MNTFLCLKTVVHFFSFLIHRVRVNSLSRVHLVEITWIVLAVRVRRDRIWRIRPTISRKISSKILLLSGSQIICGSQLTVVGNFSTM